MCVLAVYDLCIFFGMIYIRILDIGVDSVPLKLADCYLLVFFTMVK